MATGKPPYFDILNREITPGCYLAYGHALGRCAAIRIGRVVEVKPLPDEGGNGKARINVMGVEEHSWRGPGLRACSKVGVLQFPERCIVLDDAQVPEKYRKILDGFKPK